MLGIESFGKQTFALQQRADAGKVPSQLDDRSTVARGEAPLWVVPELRR